MIDLFSFQEAGALRESNSFPLIVIGTRPEAIKLSPLILEFQTAGVNPYVLLSGQHKTAGDTLREFGICETSVLRPVEFAGIPQQVGAMVQQIGETIGAVLPGMVVAQGDTSTVSAAALAAFYSGVPFAHVEAGLRTGNLSAPWPEEFNRRLAAIAAAWHFAPTRRAGDALIAERCAGEISVVGNTGIDALRIARERSQGWPQFPAGFSLAAGRPLVLVTGHRRETRGGRAAIAAAVQIVARKFPRVLFAWVGHPNARPDAVDVVGGPNVIKSPPVPYFSFVRLLSRCAAVVTDSGGLQEESAVLGVPLFVTRDETERPESIDAGGVLVGSYGATLAQELSIVLESSPRSVVRDFRPGGLFGDGFAARRIVRELMLGAVA